MTNPLQQYFRQPKIYIKLPSNGVYNKPGAIQGDAAKLSVFGMTGMDEILVKTPDALFSGESTVKVIESCVPAIKDAWDVASIDINLLLIAIRIATYESTLQISHTCSNCASENEYEIDLVKLMDHYNLMQYANTVNIAGLAVKLRPLTYKQISDFGLRNFQIQQQAAQIISEEEKTDENQQRLQELYAQLADIQNEIYVASVESVQTDSANVTDPAYITEFLKNCDANIFDAIKTQAEANSQAWAIPKQEVACSSCNTVNKIDLDLDVSSFFARA